MCWSISGSGAAWAAPARSENGPARLQANCIAFNGFLAKLAAEQYVGRNEADRRPRAGELGRQQGPARLGFGPASGEGGGACAARGREGAGPAAGRRGFYGL